MLVLVPFLILSIPRSVLIHPFFKFGSLEIICVCEEFWFVSNPITFLFQLAFISGGNFFEFVESDEDLSMKRMHLIACNRFSIICNDC